MKVTPTSLPEVLLIEPDVFEDDRGYFFETYERQRYEAAGIHDSFVQDNISRSRRGALRGLHFQNPHPQGKLVSVLYGEVFDVAVDIRVGSPRFGAWIGERLSADNKIQLFVPPGFAHGFCVISQEALFHYKCTEYYRPESEMSVAWNDPALAIEWPLKDPNLSPRDAVAPLLSDIDRQKLPVFDH